MSVISGATPARDPVLSIRDLSIDYGVADPVHAVKEVNLELGRGEVLGLAGESGCGKSTLAYAVNRLLPGAASIPGGEVVFHEADGTEVDVLALEGEALREFRWKRIAMVFQGAMNALNPVTSISSQLGDVLVAHDRSATKKQRRDRSGELLDLVGVDPRRLSSYPHELSGGMRQRVMIAMALALRPDVMVMDEPTTALDVVVQREILSEISRLREEFGFAVVFITHDLSLLLEISDRIAVMYAGRIVEHGTAGRVFQHPQHPYTAGLLSSFPSLTGPRRELHGVPGSPPDLSRDIPGCAFAPRCPYRQDVCDDALPVLRPHPSSPYGTDGAAACFAHEGERYDGPVPPPALERGEFRPIETADVVS